MQRPSLEAAFDALAPHAEVSARLCEAASEGRLNVPQEVHRICKRIGLPGARAADVERALLSGLVCGVFEKHGAGTWASSDTQLAGKLGPLLKGAEMYRQRVHRDADTVEVVLTRPAAPSRLALELGSMLGTHLDYRDTKLLLPKIAESAARQFVVMTPYFDEVGAAIVLNLFQQTAAPEKVLILRAGSDGAPPPGLGAVGLELQQLGVKVVNFRLDRPDAPGNETFHAKVVLADDKQAYVGSSNMNKWSFEYSLELGLHVTGKAAARVSALLSAVVSVAAEMNGFASGA